MTLTAKGSLIGLVVIACIGCLHAAPASPSHNAPLAAVCSLPKEVGPCKAAFRRFYFNSTTGTCERFLYGGCRGNANNFQAEFQCQSACTCFLPPDMGQWRFNGQYCRWTIARYFDSSSNTCRRFLYWGCGGNGNRFPTQRACNNACSAVNTRNPYTTNNSNNNNNGNNKNKNKNNRNNNRSRYPTTG